MFTILSYVKGPLNYDFNYSYSMEQAVNILDFL